MNNFFLYLHLCVFSVCFFKTMTSFIVLCKAMLQQRLLLHCVCVHCEHVYSEYKHYRDFLSEHQTEGCYRIWGRKVGRQGHWERPETKNDAKTRGNRGKAENSSKMSETQIKNLRQKHIGNFYLLRRDTVRDDHVRK